MPSLPRLLALVSAGAIVGSLVRFAVSLVLIQNLAMGGWPWATFTVNAVGCLLMGLFLGWVAVRHVPSYATPLIAVGFFGGLTTFSAFAEDIVALAKVSAYSVAALFVVVSVAGGLIAVKIGKMIAARVWR